MARFYECGEFRFLGQEWLIVVSETGSGTHAAQSAVSHAHYAFAPFEVQIVTGVGGSRKDESSLGSVVAGEQVYMPYAGKFGPEGLEFRPRTFVPDPRLLWIARKVCRDKLWQNRIRDPLAAKLPPRDQYPIPFPPTAVVKPIVSVEAVLNNRKSELEALIAQAYSDAHIVEMEGYGAEYAASQERTPSIVVRGVSDMTSAKTAGSDEMLQPIAACHAAAFAFEVLSHWGQIYRTSDVGTRDGLHAPTLVGVPHGTAQPTSGRTSSMRTAEQPIVLNLNEEFPGNLEMRLAEIEAKLREIADSNTVKVLGAKPGSLQVWVADPEGALRDMGIARLRDALSTRSESELLGMVEAHEYESLQALRVELAGASKELMAWPRTLPGGDIIARSELTELTEQIERSTSSTMALIGDPGSGKSALLSTLSHQFVRLGWPVLAIKGDLLDPDISTEGDLQERLGLSERPSTLLKRLAAFQPVLLVLDQLDALAKYLDLHTARLTILLNLVRRLGGTNNIHVVLSSRVFEFEHDVRLKAAAAESVSLQLPAWSQVVTILEAHDVQAEGWPEEAKEVIRAPQALSVYLQLEGRETSEAFKKYQTMLEHLWTERILNPDGGARRGRLAIQIVETMATKESLWVASARFDDHVEDISALQGAGILTKVNGRIGFTHQTIFEHALARSFARGEGHLSEFVRERQSSLFLRPKLLASLTYLRETEVDVYCSEIEDIWNTENLRRHLRVLLIDFLGSQKQPTDRETLLMVQALNVPEQSEQAFRSMIGSPGWFDRFSRLYIAESMRGSNEAADLQIGILARAWTFAPGEVLRLLQQHWIQDKHHDNRTWWVLQGAGVWTEEMLEIACTILDRTEIDPFRVDHLAETIGVAQPEFGLRIIRAQLDRDLEAAKTTVKEQAGASMPAFDTEDERVVWLMQNEPYIPFKTLIERKDGSETVPAFAENHPGAFIEILWPWFEECLDALHRRTTERTWPPGYADNMYADFRFEQEHRLNLPEPTLLGGLRIAAERLAESEPNAWRTWVARLKECEVAPVQRLIAHSFAHAPEEFAGQALAFLLEDPRRCVLGSHEDITGTSSRLVRATSNHWTEADIERFEIAIRQYKPAAPKEVAEPGQKRAWLNLVRKTRLALLRALPNDRVSVQTRQLVDQEMRTFGDPTTVHFRVIGPKWIGGIMNDADIARASDEDVINAFRTVPDASAWDHPRRFMMGGNIQLAREFAAAIKEDPERAERVLLRLEPETGTRAAGYALDTMSERAAPEHVLRLLHEVVARRFDSEDFRVSASRAIGKLLDREVEIPDQTAAILENWLAQPTREGSTTDEGSPEDDSEPEAEHGDNQSGGNDGAAHRSLLWGLGGISMVPGGDYQVLETLIRMRLARKEYNQVDDMLCAYLDRSKEVDEWDMLIRHIPCPHPSNPGRGMGILNRIFREVPKLVESKPAAFLLANSPSWSRTFADTQLDRWRDFDSRTGRQAYGEIVALTCFKHPSHAWALERLETLIADQTMEEARAGAALTAAHMWNDPSKRGNASEVLTRLLVGGDPGVWNAVSEVFRLVDQLTPDPPTISLLKHLAEMDLPLQAPGWHLNIIAGRLGTMLPHHAKLLGEVAKNLVGAAKRKGSVGRPTGLSSGPEMVDLAITLHRLGAETQEIGTELIEDLAEIDALAVHQTLDKIDNRFRETAATRRPRLARPERYRSERRRRTPPI